MISDRSIAKSLFHQIGFRTLEPERVRLARLGRTFIGYRIPHCGPRVLAANKVKHIDCDRFLAWKGGAQDVMLEGEIVEDLKRLIRGWQPVIPKDWIVSYPPPGASLKKGNGESYPIETIARLLAMDLDLEVVELFERGEGKTRHGGWASREMGAFSMTACCPAPVLLIDDFATTGGTMIRCLDACLKSGVAAWGFVWTTY